MNYYTLILTSMALCSLPVESFASFSGTIFGTVPCTEYYTTLARKALQTCTIADADSYPVHQMSSFGKHIIGNGFCSITPWGVWINETTLNTHPPAEQYFILCQEAAHYHYKHHAQVYTAIPFILYTLIKKSPLLRKQCINSDVTGANCIATFVIGCVFAYGIDRLFLRPWVKYQDKQADLYATQQLLKTSQTSTLNAHINFLIEMILQGYGDEDCAGWAPSYTEQYEYLQAFLS